MKIAVIGGAGVRTVIFINGLLKRYKDLHIEEAMLYDIDYKKLGIIERLCNQVIRRENKDLKLSVCEDVKEAIKGADYIVTTLRVGGDHSRVIDETVALKDGVIGQETTGVGGFSMAVRTIPVLLDYCKLIKEYAPNAIIFNFTNPSGLVTQALKKAGYKNVIGICDAPSSCKFRMAAKLGVDEKDLYVEFYGLNHLSWIRSVKIKDKEILHAGSVFDLADAGDERAIKIVEEATKDLGQMFATIACICDPDIFVIGGGMTKSADKFLPAVIENYKAMSHTALHNTPFVIAMLDEPGIIGAAMLPMSEGI